MLNKSLIDLLYSFVHLWIQTPPSCTVFLLFISFAKMSKAPAASFYSCDFTLWDKQMGVKYVKKPS